MIGKVVNYRYEILEKAGDGSLYSVYKARDKVLNRLVAVKILHGNFASNQDFSARLVSEVQQVQDLVHPNIARVFEADSQDGVSFVAVEYVRGVNLKDRIRRTAPFTISYAVDIASAVCEALEYAHSNGIVHGDVRPQNILTNPDGQVKLTDFGIAEAIGAFPALRDNTLLRSVHYTAPEVLKGSNPHPASDIYSLGVVLFEMVTGSVPFDADSAMAIAAKHLSDKPPVPHEMNSAVPKPLSEIILKALAKNPSDRYQTAGHMLADLQRIRETLRTGVAAPPRSAKDSTIVAPQAEDAYADEEPEQDLRHTLLVLLGVMFLTLVFVGGFLVVYKGARGQQIKVPNLVGKTLPEAEEIAKTAHIELMQYREEFNERVEAGRIYMTNPPPDGLIPRDKPQVKIWISKGPRLVRIPNLLGLTQEEAIRRLQDAGFVVGKLDADYSENTEVGKIISQKPTSGEHREPLSAIRLVVSQGPKPQEPIPPDTGEDAPTPEPKQFDVKVNVPAEGPDPQTVRIVVSDDESEDRVIYEEPRHPGEQFTLPVSGTGNVEIRVYVDDKELLSQTF